MAEVSYRRDRGGGRGVRARCVRGGDAGCACGVSALSPRSAGRVRALPPSMSAFQLMLRR